VGLAHRLRRGHPPSARPFVWSLVAVAALAAIVGVIFAGPLWRWLYYDMRGYSVGPPTETWPVERSLGPRDVRVAVVGDTGTGDADQYATSDAIAVEHNRRPYDALALLGDLIYNDGDVDKFDEVVTRPYGPLLDTGVEALPALGNHDYQNGDADEIMERFGRADRWYAEQIGEVLFVVLDTNQVEQSEQTAWLRATLEVSSARWCIALMHHPPYSAGVHGSDDGVRDAWSGLFAEYGVELVLAGHDHDYQRSKPIDGVVYVVSGGGGATQRPTGSESFTEFAAGETLHYLDLQISRHRLLGQAIDIDGRVFDSFVLQPSP
jgi:hypothetical protein